MLITAAFPPKAGKAASIMRNGATHILLNGLRALRVGPRATSALHVDGRPPLPVISAPPVPRLHDRAHMSQPTAAPRAECFLLPAPSPFGSACHYRNLSV